MIQRYKNIKTTTPQNITTYSLSAFNGLVVLSGIIRADKNTGVSPLFYAEISRQAMLFLPILIH